MKNLITLVLLGIASFSFSQIADKAENISPLLIGEQIPNVKIRDVEGELIETNTIFNKKTVIVVYRGGWCPYCNSQLSEMQEIEKEILSLGYQIVAISPDAPKFLKETIKDDKLNYSLYSDSEGIFAQVVGIAFAKDKPKLEKYSEGKNPGFLPVPTVYITNGKGEIQFLYINPDYSTRLKGNLLLAVLKNL